MSTLLVSLCCVQTWPHRRHRVGHFPRHRLGDKLLGDDEVCDEWGDDGDDPAAEVGRRGVERVALDVEVQDVGEVRGQFSQEHVVAEILEKAFCVLTRLG